MLNKTFIMNYLSRIEELKLPEISIALSRLAMPLHQSVINFFFGGTIHESVITWSITPNF